MAGRSRFAVRGTALAAFAFLTHALIASTSCQWDVKKGLMTLMGRSLDP